MMSPDDHVTPPTWTFLVRDRSVTLVAMGGKDLVDWGELHLLVAQELLAAYQLASRGLEQDSALYREILIQIARAEVVRVVRCTGLPADFVINLSPPERQLILARQNALNGNEKELEELQKGLVKTSYAQQSS